MVKCCYQTKQRGIAKGADKHFAGRAPATIDLLSELRNHTRKFSRMLLVRRRVVHQSCASRLAGGGRALISAMLKGLFEVMPSVDSVEH